MNEELEKAQKVVLDKIERDMLLSVTQRRPLVVSEMPDTRHTFYGIPLVRAPKWLQPHLEGATGCFIQGAEKHEASGTAAVTVTIHREGQQPETKRIHVWARDLPNWPSLWP